MRRSAFRRDGPMNPDGRRVYRSCDRPRSRIVPPRPAPVKITISVPKPCHEDWNTMTDSPDVRTGIGGRHCDKCEHTVMDLTRVSDAQLIDLFRKDAMPKCARFTQGQLDRVIALEERAPRLLPAAAVGVALAFASPDAEAQTCAPTVGKMMISQPAPVAHAFETGEVNVAAIDTTDQILQRIQMGQPSIPITHPEPIITGDTVADYNFRETSTTWLTSSTSQYFPGYGMLSLRHTIGQLEGR